MLYHFWKILAYNRKELLMSLNSSLHGFCNAVSVGHSPLPLELKSVWYPFLSQAGAAVEGECALGTVDLRNQLSRAVTPHARLQFSLRDRVSP